MTALEKAQNLLLGAEACWQSQSFEGCALCCYAAMFWAAIAASEHFGIKQKEWTHGSLQNRFGLEGMKRRQVFPRRLGDYFKDAHELRKVAHYELCEISQKEAERMLWHAKEFARSIKRGDTAMSRTKVRNWRNLLEKRVTELIGLAKELCPEAEVVVTSPIGDEDAAIEVLVPSEKYDELRQALIQKSVDINWEDGFFISTVVHEKSER